MNFGQAIEALKAGNSTSRAGWNGKNMKIFLETRDGFEPCLVLINAAGGKQPGWNASTPDVLAEDWGVVA